MLRAFCFSLSCTLNSLSLRRRRSLGSPWRRLPQLIALLDAINEFDAGAASVRQVAKGFKERIVHVLFFEWLDDFEITFDFGREDLLLQFWVEHRIEEIIAHELEGRSMQLVRAGFGDYVDDAAGDSAELGLVIVRLDLEFLD